MIKFHVNNKQISNSCKERVYRNSPSKNTKLPLLLGLFFRVYKNYKFTQTKLGLYSLFLIRTILQMMKHLVPLLKISQLVWVFLKIS